MTIVGGPKRHGANFRKAGSLNRLHRRAHSSPSAPGCGTINLGLYSSLRKRMRAARRGYANGDTFKAWWPAQPADVLKMLRRHPWYRRKEAWDKLRQLMI